jgi:serine/threonine-protein kinase RsbW
MNYRRILGRVEREEFVGRDRELEEIVRHPSRDKDERGLLLLAAPPAGVSELLRQAYDELFAGRGETIPLYYAFARRDQTALEAARRFFTTFLQQYIAYTRIDPSLCDAPLSLNDLAELALPADYEWIANLLESFGREVGSSDERAAIRFCFSAPQKAATSGRHLFTMIDEIHLGDQLEGAAALGPHLAQVLARSDKPYALAGARRRVLDLVRDADQEPVSGQVIHLEKLSDDDARRLVELIARKHEVEINDPTCDLIVQQLGASPFMINALVRQAQDDNKPLTTFLNCQQVYVDELMGGRINRYFSALLSELAPDPQIREKLVRILYESLLSEVHKSSLQTWKKRIGLNAAELERIVHQLHVLELVNASGSYVEVPADCYVWHDYLRAAYRLDNAGEARALVVADTLQQTLKRAPRTMARKYRREAALGLRDLLSSFNCQRVPSALFHYDQFAASYKGVDDDQVHEGLDAEADLVRLPQVVHVAACTAFVPTMPCDEERCVVGHAFDAADYTEASEVVWLAAEIESKLAANRRLTEGWLDRLSILARDLDFTRVRIWLIAPEGFSPAASQLLKKRDAYGSSRRQIELLTARIRSESEAKEKQASRPDDYDMVIPMGSDTELIAARAVEQIARSVNFQPEAINQIKTALIEACINAAEHSLSPDRKIYQRFRVEDDKLVVTVASRGVVPASEDGRRPGDADTKSRRGWGLKLIQTLMDEVEFERVDDGTQLRMVKYIRK